MTPEQEKKHGNKALHTVWASRIYETLHNGEGLEDYPACTQTEQDYQQDSYPIEYIPIVGLAMNIMFNDDELGIQLLRHYGINEDIIQQCRTYVFG